MQDISFGFRGTWRNLPCLDGLAEPNSFLNKLSHFRHVQVGFRCTELNLLWNGPHLRLNILRNLPFSSFLMLGIVPRREFLRGKVLLGPGKKSQNVFLVCCLQSTHPAWLISKATTQILSLHVIIYLSTLRITKFKTY